MPLRSVDFRARSGVAVIQIAAGAYNDGDLFSWEQQAMILNSDDLVNASTPALAHADGTV